MYILMIAKPFSIYFVLIALSHFLLLILFRCFITKTCSDKESSGEHFRYIYIAFYHVQPLAVRTIPEL